jgi:hypothetical protein
LSDAAIAALLGGTFLRTKVDITHPMDDGYFVTTIKPGEKVVSSGVFKLRNGAAVTENNELTPKATETPKPATPTFSSPLWVQLVDAFWRMTLPLPPLMSRLPNISCRCSMRSNIGLTARESARWVLDRGVRRLCLVEVMVLRSIDGVVCDVFPPPRPNAPVRAQLAND